MKPKNILLILTDQQRRDSLGCCGNPYARTPCLDGLARESVCFERAYAANPICMPSRHSLFSGRYPHNHGVWTNGVPAQDSGMNLPHYLSAHGYRTASIGKIHFSPTDIDSFNTSPESAYCWADERADYDFHGPYFGFDHIELTVGHARQKGHYRKWFFEHGGTEGMFEGASDCGAPQSMRMRIPERLHCSTYIGKRACAFLRERDRNLPFFLTASFPDPHHPFDPPEETAAHFSLDRVKMPLGDASDLATRPPRYLQHHRGRWHRDGHLRNAAYPEGYSEAQTREMIRNTDAMVSLIDRNAGHILDTLKEEGLWEDTVVVFTSDHGELLGDHGLWLKGPFFYEGLVGVPLLIRVPGVTPRRSDALFSGVDLAPTLCELLGFDIPAYMDGVSQAPHLADPGFEPRSRCMIEYRNGFGKNDLAYRVLCTRRYKYALCENGEQELFDLETDGEERTNAALDPAYGETMRELRDALLLEMLKSENHAPEQISHA